MIDVAIIGAGPVGTLLAAELARHGTSSVLFEQRAGPGAGTRAVGVHGVALAAMEGSGATDRLLAGAVRVRVGEARRGGRTLGLVRFDRLRMRHPYVATLPQHATEAALAATASAWGAPDVQRGCRVDAIRPGDDGVEIDVAGREYPLPARIAVVAGGLRSRALLPVPERSRHYRDRYLMTDCADTGDDGERAVVHLDRSGVLESFPLPGERRRYVAWIDAAPGRPAADRPVEEQTTDAVRLRDAVATRTRSDAAAASVQDATGFGVARSRVAAMRGGTAGRVFAIGDAAHEVSPIGGQGMNLGLIDAVTLAPLLARWLRDDDAPQDLARWERERLRAADRSGRIAAVNTALGRPSRAGAAVMVRAALGTPVAGLLAHAYAMGFDPAAREFDRS